MIADESGDFTSADAQVNPYWYAAYTSARHEKRVAEHLERKQLEYFLPLYKTVHQWKNGRKTLQLPLLPGYLFVRIALQDRLRILQIPGVVYLVGNRTRPLPVAGNDIQMLRQAVFADRNIEPHPFLTVGERVRITGGVLAGSEGVLLRKKPNFRVVLSVELITRSVVVDVGGCEVEAIGARVQ